MIDSRTLRIFLCHASEDKAEVHNLYRKLFALGFDPWLDSEKLIPGQEWDREIKNAVKNSDVVLVCLSHKSITKTGYVQKEIKFALDIADQQPENTIFIIPLRFEECKIPDRLSNWQYTNFFEKNGYNQLKKSLYIRAEQLGIKYYNYEISQKFKYQEKKIEYELKDYPKYFYIKYNKSGIEKIQEGANTQFANIVMQDESRILQNRINDIMKQSIRFRIFQQLGLDFFANSTKSPLLFYLSIANNSGCVSTILNNDYLSFLYSKFKNKSDFLIWITRLSNIISQDITPNYIQNIKIIDYLFFDLYEINIGQNTVLDDFDKLELKDFFSSIIADAMLLLHFPFRSIPELNLIIFSFNNASIFMVIKKRVIIKVYLFNVSYIPKYHFIYIDLIKNLDKEIQDLNKKTND